MSNEVDDLMDQDPLSLSKQNLEAIVQYFRNRRANAEAGIKPKKEQGPKIALDLVKLGLKKAAPPVKRRV